MLEAFLLPVLAVSAVFIVYEFYRLSNALSASSVTGQGALPFQGMPRKNLYTGMIESENTYKLDGIEKSISRLEKRLEKQEGVMSRIIEELGG